VKGGGQECKLGIAALEADGKLLEATLVCRVDTLLLVLTTQKKLPSSRIGLEYFTSRLGSCFAEGFTSLSQGRLSRRQVGLTKLLLSCMTSSLHVSLDCRGRAISAFPLRR
jgi:hypothetical protein